MCLALRIRVQGLHAQISRGVGNPYTLHPSFCTLHPTPHHLTALVRCRVQGAERRQAVILEEEGMEDFIDDSEILNPKTDISNHKPQTPNPKPKTQNFKP